MHRCPNHVLTNPATCGEPQLARRTRSEHRLAAKAIVALLLMLCACGPSGSTVVAEFRDGRIVRSEFVEFQRMVQAESAGQEDPHQHDHDKTTAKPEQTLLRLADIRLAAAEARRLGLHEAKTYQAERAALERRVDLESIMVQVHEIFPEARYHFVELQHVYKRGLSDSQAAALLARLNELPEGELDAFVSKTTELPGFGATAGRQLPLCASCGNRTHEFLLETALGARARRFARVPGVVAEGVWFVRSLSRKTVQDSELESTLRPFYQAQADRVRARGDRPPGIPLSPEEIAKAQKEYAAFVRGLHRKNPDLFSFLALTFERLEKAGLLWPPAPSERQAVMHRAWAADPALEKARRSPGGRIRREIREAEWLALLLHEKEASGASARDSEVRRLYESHRRALGTDPGLGRVSEALREDIRHRKQHVLIDRLRERLRREYALKLYADRLSSD